MQKILLLVYFLCVVKCFVPLFLPIASQLGGGIIKDVSGMLNPNKPAEQITPPLVTADAQVGGKMSQQQQAQAPINTQSPLVQNAATPQNLAYVAPTGQAVTPQGTANTAQEIPNVVVTPKPNPTPNDPQAIQINPQPIPAQTPTQSTSENIIVPQNTIPMIPKEQTNLTSAANPNLTSAANPNLTPANPQTEIAPVQQQSLANTALTQPQQQALVNAALTQQPPLNVLSPQPQTGGMTLGNTPVLPQPNNPVNQGQSNV